MVSVPWLGSHQDLHANTCIFLHFSQFMLRRQKRYQPYGPWEHIPSSIWTEEEATLCGAARKRGPVTCSRCDGGIAHPRAATRRGRGGEREAKAGRRANKGTGRPLDIHKGSSVTAGWCSSAAVVMFYDPNIRIFWATFFLLIDLRAPEQSPVSTLHSFSLFLYACPTPKGPARRGHIGKSTGSEVRKCSHRPHFC